PRGGRGGVDGPGPRTPCATTWSGSASRVARRDQTSLLSGWPCTRTTVGRPASPSSATHNSTSPACTRRSRAPSIPVMTANLAVVRAFVNSASGACRHGPGPPPGRRIALRQGVPYGRVRLQGDTKTALRSDDRVAAGHYRLGRDCDRDRKPEQAVPPGDRA